MAIAITVDQLRAARACADQLARFESLFPEGYCAETLAQFETDCVAHASRFDFDWAGSKLVGVEYRRQRAPLVSEYPRQCAPLWVEYERQRALLEAEYERQRAPLWAEYRRQYASLRVEYERQCAPLWAEYERQCAALFARLYWVKENR